MGYLIHCFIFVLLFSLEPATACLDGNCRMLAFPAPFFFDHKHLVNHTIRIEDNVDFDICQLLCYHEEYCVSINYDLNTRSCELNNATHRGHDNEFVYRENSLYHGAESACDHDGHRCDNGGTCQSGFTDKLYRCLCPSGFTGERCETDIDECKAANTHNCSGDAICNNTIGSFHCTCKPGYAGDGHNCTDIDECAQEPHDCLPSNASCVNTAGSYNCVCHHGYVGDGKTSCEPEECKTYTNLTSHDMNEKYKKKIDICYSKDLATGWFRFEGQAGNRIATTCPRKRHCGASLPGWMDGKHPTVDEGAVRRKVCFRNFGDDDHLNCCKYDDTIRVRMCAGSYYVYFLKVPPDSYCSLRYCSTNLTHT